MWQPSPARTPTAHRPFPESASNIGFKSNPEAALGYGVKVTGATVHFVNEIPDGGRIIMQKAVYIEDGDTPEVLQKRVMEQAEWLILPQAIDLIANGKVKVEDGKAVILN